MDLSVQITALIKKFAFCPVTLDYDMESDVVKEVKYCFLAVVKEALNNIMKHSNATKASITYVMHPPFISSSSGITAQLPPSPGNRTVWASQYGRAGGGAGRALRVTFQDGVTLFLSIPKEVRHGNPDRG